MTPRPIPPHVTADPPAAALDWAARAAGGDARVVGVRALRRSRWHANHLLVLQPAGGQPYELILRRWARPGWDQADPDFDARREASVLALLAPTDVPAPRLVAVDAHASHCDVPALLMTRLDGRPPGRGIPWAAVASQMAAALVVIHGVGAAPDAVPSYRPWHDLSSVDPPAWMAGSAPWRALFDFAAGERPPGPSSFIHRDYHHGNTLWVGDRLTGIVDWSTGSWGPRGVDVAHARWNLAIAYGLRAAERFLDDYRAQASPPYEHAAYWDAAQLVDGLTDTGPEEPAPSPARRLRLERYIVSILD